MREGWEAEAGHWATFARTPGRDRSHDDINLPALRELLPEPAGAALDLGCGEGRLSRYLRTAGYRVAGADAAPTMVRLATAHPDAAPALLADATALPFGDGTFDLVVAPEKPGNAGQGGGASAQAFRMPQSEFLGRARAGGIIYPFILLFIILAIWKGSTF